jgi:Tfp pilus assembly protein PilX
VLRLRRVFDEDGIALVLALGILIVLGIIVTAGVTYTTSNTRASGKSAARTQAREYAETAVNNAVSVLQRQISVSGNPSSANLLGCAGANGTTTDTTPPSNCTSPTPITVCFVTGSTCTAGAANTATAYGFYSGTNAQTFLGRTVPASTWLIVATGYAYDPAISGPASQTTYTQIKVSSLNSGDVAAVWNHVFLTSPLVPNVCQTNISGNNLIIDVPLFVIGNLCITGSNDFIKEVGQAVDLSVGGKLSMNGPNAQIGASSTVPITSGVVVGGCTSGAVTTATTACNSTNYRYYVKNLNTFDAQDAPGETTADITSDYATFDPGPKHACKSGTSPAGLASSVFDSDTTYNDNAGTFELTPSSSYDCQSASAGGASVGELKWDNTTKKLTVNGSIFIDGNLTISQSLTYTGTAIIEVAGTVTINGNGTTVCATSPCDYTLTGWQGSSTNTSMLTLAPLLGSTTSFTFAGNTQSFQGSLWTQPSSNINVIGNSVTIEGPMAIGSITNSNNVNMKPLPVIKNMPVGAPLPPNTGVTLGTPLTVG